MAVFFLFVCFGAEAGQRQQDLEQHGCCCCSSKTLTALSEHRAVQEGLGIAAEHGYFFRAAGATGWEPLHDLEDGAVHAWREMVLPILQVRPCAGGVQTRRCLPKVCMFAIFESCSNHGATSLALVYLCFYGIPSFIIGR